MRSIQALRHVLMASVCLATPVAGLAEETFALDEILVRGNLEAVDPDRTGSTVRVLGGEDIAAAPFTLLGDALAQIPGVAFRAYGPPGTASSITLRGAPASYIPVLIDGIDVGDPASPRGEFYFSTLGTSAIDRVEVLTGSQSALYGANAVGGVVNISTFRASALGTEQRVALEYGSYATKKASYSWATKTERGELALNLSHMSSQGFSAREERDGNYEADGFRANRIGFYSQYEVAPGVVLGVNGFFEDSRGHNDAASGDAPSNVGKEYMDRRASGLRAFSEFDTGAVSHKLEATYYRSDRQSYSATPATPSDFDGNRMKLAYRGAADLGAQARLVFGADTEREEVAGNGHATTRGMFSELTWAPGDRIDLAATARHDDNSLFGGFNSLRLSGVYRLQDDLLLRAAIGNGFQAPTLYQLNGPYGDPRLAPEESESLEIGVEKRWGERASLRATAFSLEAENLIGFDYTATVCGQSFGCYNQVPGQSQRKGLELEGRLTLSDRVGLAGAYTYIDSSVSTGWAGVARHDLSLSAKAEITPTLSGMVSVQRVLDRPTGLDDYTLAHATLSHDLGAGKEVYLHVENLFDEHYQTIDGYGTSDRAFYVGLRAQF